MKNLLSKIFKKQEKTTIKEIETAPTINLEEKFDIYIHILETGKDNEKNLSEGRFVLLSGMKGIYKIENISKMGDSAQYKIELLRKNLPKDYDESIERITNYSPNYQDEPFNIIP